MCHIRSYSLRDKFRENRYFLELLMYNRLIDSSEVPAGSSLASHDSVSAFVHQMLTIASAGGMTETRAENLYEEIMGCYANLDGSASEAFRNDFLKILNSTSPDRN